MPPLLAVRELHQEVLPAPPDGGARLPGARLLPVRQAARVQADAAARAPRLARRHPHPLQRRPRPAEAGDGDPEGRQEQPADGAGGGARPGAGAQVHGVGGGVGSWGGGWLKKNFKRSLKISIDR